MSFDDILSNFIDKCYEDLTWRKKELMDLKSGLKPLKKLNQEEFNFFKRGSIALTYAHLEGGVKNLFITYINFINELLDKGLLSLEKNNIDEVILDLIFFDKIKVFAQNTKEKRLKGLEYCKKFFVDKEVIKIESKLINTKSNMNFKVLKEIYKLVNLNMNENISINKKFIDQLVNRRNAIAHGENSSDDIEIVIENIDKVLMILGLVKYDIEEGMKKFKDIV